MKILTLLIILSVNSAFALDNYKFRLTNTDRVNELDDSEVSKLGLLVDTEIARKIELEGIDIENQSFEVTYSCSQVPTSKVFCTLNFNGSLGTMATFAIEYNRDTDEPQVIGHSFN